MNKNEMRMRTELEVALKEKGQLSMHEAIDLLNVSESTVRRMFQKLEDSESAIRVYGGIRLPSVAAQYEYDVIVGKHRKEKNQIGAMAASMVSDNDFMYIDCGTTTLHLCNYLVQRLSEGSLSNITVVTNSLINLEILNKYCTTILLGGNYSAKRKSFSGVLTESFIQHFYFNVAFLGADGYTPKIGFSTSQIETAHLSGIAAARANRPVVLLDSTKIGKRSCFVYGISKDVKEIITDSRASQDAIEAIQSDGIIVHVASTKIPTK